ncbi:MAG: glycosyltransferase family A protein [Alphaproteobacteria bacterium]|nr:glycosyltransferase family A protein [Alphaproteobacteria bacterium]
MNDISSPRFSVILCNYNHDRYLKRSLPAILDQLRDCDELLLVEDGSSDNSLEVMRQHAGDRSNVRILINEQNRGVVWSGNRALAASGGDYVAWWSADDLVLDGIFDAAAAVLKEFPGAGIVATETIVETLSNDAVVDTKTYRFGLEDRGYLSASDFVAENKRRYLWLSSSGLFLRRDTLSAGGGWREELSWLTDWFSVYVTALRHGVTYVATPYSVNRARMESFGRRAAREKSTRQPVVERFFDLLSLSEYSDVRASLCRCPLVISHALGERVLLDLLRRPRDWDLLLSVAFAITRARI